MNKHASRRWPSRLVGRKRLLAPKEAFSHMVLPSKTFCPPYQMITLLHLKYFLWPTMQGCRFQSQVAVRTFTTRQKLPPHSACWSWGCIAEQAAPQLLLLVRLLSEGSMSVFPKQPPENLSASLTMRGLKFQLHPKKNDAEETVTSLQMSQVLMSSKATFEKFCNYTLSFIQSQIFEWRANESLNSSQYLI